MKSVPSMDAWLKEARQSENAHRVGMYLTHNGVVRASSRASVRCGEAERKVKAMLFSYDGEKLEAALSAARAMEGIYYIRVWLNEGELKTGDDIMYVLVGGDIRPRVVDCLQYLVGRIKDECVERQKYMKTEKQPPR